MANGSLTGQWRTVLTTAVVVLLLGNAVALSALEEGESRPGGDLPPAAGDVSVPTVPTLPEVTVPTVVTTTSVAAGGKAARATTATTVAPEPMSGGEYTFVVTVDPLCVRVGAPLTVTLRLKPNQGGVFIASYADGNSYDTMHSGWADADGNLASTKPAPMVPGPATLLAQASDEARRTGWTRVNFRVVGATEPC